MGFWQDAVVAMPEKIGAFELLQHWQNGSGGGYSYADGQDSMYSLLR